MKIVSTSIVFLFIWLSGSLVRAQTEVRISSYDDFPLNAVFHPSQQVGPGILLLHQCDRRGPHSGLEGLASGLNELGFNVIVPDYRTYGKSVGEEFPAGEWQLAGSHTDADLKFVYQFLITQRSVDSHRIGILGASCGGRYGINLAARYAEIKTIVFLSSLIGSSASQQLSTLDHLPLLAAVSEDDPNGSTTSSMQRAIDESQHNSSQILIYPGDAHGAPLLAQEQELSSLILEWFVRFFIIQTPSE